MARCSMAVPLNTVVARVTHASLELFNNYILTSCNNIEVSLDAPEWVSTAQCMFLLRFRWWPRASLGSGVILCRSNGGECLVFLS